MKLLLAIWATIFIFSVRSALLATNECNIGNASYAIVARYDDRWDEKMTHDLEWMAEPTTWVSTQPWEGVLNEYYYSSERYASVRYYDADDNMIHFIDIKQSLDGQYLYAIVLPEDRDGHGCVIIKGVIGGSLDSWLDEIIQ